MSEPIVRDKVNFPDRERDEKAIEQFISDPQCVECHQCVCASYTFDELIKIAKERDLTPDQVIALTGAGTDCEVCVPYIHRAIREGTPSVEVKSHDPTMWIHKDGILENEPPKMDLEVAAAFDPRKIARASAVESQDKESEVGIKKEIE